MTTSISSFLLVFCALLAISASSTNSLSDLRLNDASNTVAEVLNSSQQDIQISEARCMRLLDEIEMDEEIREKAVTLLMSSNTLSRRTVIMLCNSLYDRPKSFVRRVTQLLLKTGSRDPISEAVVQEGESGQYLTKPAYINELGQAVFKNFPVYRSWLDSLDPNTSVWNNVGDYVDVNGDGLLDYVVAFIDNRSGNMNTGVGVSYYRATFVNNGNGEWIMVACEGTADGWFRFVPCH